jgi:signal transduction histidine kinase
MEYYENLITIALIGSIIGFLIIFIMANHLAKITIEPIREHNKELGSYSHNVAHELRTPLTVIRQNLELLRIKPTEKLIHSTDEEIT